MCDAPLWSGAGNRVRINLQQTAERQPRETDANDCGDERQQQAFDDKLCEEAAACGTESSPHRELALARLGAREEQARELERELADAGMRATKVEDDELVRFLEGQGRLVRLGPDHAIGRAGYEAALDALLAECRSAGEISLARFRDLVGVGRRDAQLILERFDRDGITRRVGDGRVLRRAAAATSTPSS